ncbi:MAG TPA: ATP-binding cassette domain-containing protein [Gemmataceae bacterium]|nr:ATP-binding cassette domain-containing protein [Gemmataceae bacterium]
MPSTRGHLWSRFVIIARPFFRSELRWQAIGLLALILVFIFCLNGLNVLSNYMNRDFMSAVVEGEASRSVFLALLWAGVFAGLTIVAVFKAFTEERLRLRWREWLTRHLIDRYLSSRAYYRMQARADVDNPDQRITEDVRTFTEHALALLLIITNSTITLVSFCGVLWSITPWLFLAAVGYATLGTCTTIILGRRLVKLDVQQFRKEADLRYDLIQTRVHAEPIALLGGEADENRRLRRRLAAVVENMKGIIGLSRNISFFTIGFDYLIQLIPLLIVAPLYMRGEVPFGAVTQAQGAFLLVMGAFALIVKEFQRISTFGAVVERLGSFCEVLEEEAAAGKKSPIEMVEDDTRLAFEGLTLVTPRDGRLLVQDLSVEIADGQRLLILGPGGSGRTSVLRAAAGLWTAGQGRVIRPPLGQIMFLPQQPYLRPGTLRDQLLYATRANGLTDEQILAVLHLVGFEPVLERVGGLDAERDWPHTLSLGEQQRLAFARLLLSNPRFAFLDEPTSSLDAEQAHHLYEVLSRTPITYISAASDPSLREYHNLVVELAGARQDQPSRRLCAAIA